MLGPYLEMGVTVAATHTDSKGNTWKAGYHPGHVFNTRFSC